MPPTHPSQADVAAAYRTLIAHETEPKEQDFYRTRLQRVEQATEPECEFDCRSRIAAAGVGVYCPQCSAKCADTDLATQLAKAIRAAWVDRLDWDELAHAALEFLTSTGRLIPAGGMALTAERVEDVKIVLGQLERGGPAFEAAHERLRALFPATEPAEEPQRLAPVSDCCLYKTPECFTGHPAPAEPAEEETKAELCAVRLCVLPARHSGVHADREGLRWNNPASSPVVPAPTETGPWKRIEDVPVGVLQIKDRHGRTWLVVGGTWRFEWHDGNWYEPHTNINAQAPFVAAAEEG